MNIYRIKHVGSVKTVWKEWAEKKNQNEMKREKNQRNLSKWSEVNVEDKLS